MLKNVNVKTLKRLDAIWTKYNFDITKQTSKCSRQYFLLYAEAQLIEINNNRI